jgi:hypothetical protein
VITFVASTHVNRNTHVAAMLLLHLLSMYATW